MPPAAPPAPPGADPPDPPAVVDPPGPVVDVGPPVEGPIVVAPPAPPAASFSPSPSVSRMLPPQAVGAATTNATAKRERPFIVYLAVASMIESHAVGHGALRVRAQELLRESGGARGFAALHEGFDAEERRFGRERRSNLARFVAVENEERARAIALHER